MENKSMKDMEIIERIEVEGKQYLVVKFRVGKELLFGTLDAKYIDANNRLNRTISLMHLSHADTREKAKERRKESIQNVREAKQRTQEAYDMCEDEVQKAKLKELLDFLG